MYTKIVYGDDSCPSQLQSLAEDLQLTGVEGQMDGKLCSSGEGGTDGKDLPVQWNLSNPDTLGTEESVLISEVSRLQGLNCTQT